MKITALTQGYNIPSRRFRWKQYERQLINAGILPNELVSEYTSYPTSNVIQTKIKWLLESSFDSYKRVLTANKSDLVFLQRNMISDLYTFERLISKPFIYDVDDAIFLNKYGKNCYKISQNSIVTLCGNDYIADYFSKYSEVRVLPTAVDIEFYRSNTNRPFDEKIIGWVGTSSNFKYLYSIEDSLIFLLNKHHDAKITIVSDQPPNFKNIPHNRFSYIRWSPEAEITAINRFTVGIMPIFNDEFSKGKCSYKMLSYMSVGIPVVVSDFGMNASILKEGDIGYGCRNKDDWIDSISYLLENKKINIQKGQNGSDLIRRKYSSNIIGIELANIFKEYAQNSS